MFTPIDIRTVTRNALRGSGPEDPAPHPVTAKRYRWLRRQAAERPRSTPVAPFSSRSRSLPSSAR